MTVIVHHRIGASTWAPAVLDEPEPNVLTVKRDSGELLWTYQPDEWDRASVHDASGEVFTLVNQTVTDLEPHRRG